MQVPKAALDASLWDNSPCDATLWDNGAPPPWRALSHPPPPLPLSLPVSISLSISFSSPHPTPLLSLFRTAATVSPERRRVCPPLNPQHHAEAKALIRSMLTVDPDARALPGECHALPPRTTAGP